MDTTSSEQFHKKFNNMVAGIMETVREQLIETVPVDDLSHEIIIAQMLMVELDDCMQLTLDTKERLVRVADHMGPDWAQALYRAAVFITKVA